MGSSDSLKSKEAKSAYTGQTEARRKASAKYLKESVEDIRIRVPKGRKQAIQDVAQAQGESLNGFVTTAIDERIARLGDPREDASPQDERDKKGTDKHD